MSGQRGDAEPAFGSVMMGGVWATEGERLEAFCREAKTFGATAAVANMLPDPYPLAVLEQPGNPYVWFTTWGPSLDQYVSSSLTYGLYPEIYLRRNRLALRRTVRALSAHGITPWLWCGEPRFLPERFYRVYPHLRGPRVDNPNCSVVPLYAPCVDQPEIHDHYREMAAKLIGEFPEIGGLILYANDSGTGICHSDFLYPGPNGPRFCMNDPAGEKVRRLCTAILEAARESNPRFCVYLGPYIWDHERVPSFADGPDGIGSWLNGYFVAGGLEDCYANRQYPGKLDEIDYGRARAERLAVLVEQVEEIKRYGRPYLVPTTAPMEGWLSPLRMVPNPYQALGMLSLVRGQGKHLYLGGAVNDPAVVPFDVNKRVTQIYLHDPDRPADRIVHDVAVEWVGEAQADALCEAWRLCDEACRRRPMYSYTFGQAGYLLAPIVPDESRLTDEERAYYHRRSAFAVGEVKRAEAEWPLGTDLAYDEDYRTWMIDRFRRLPLPMLAEAEESLRGEIDRSSSDSSRACFAAQAGHTRAFHFFLRCQSNWLEAGRHLSPGAGEAKVERTMAEIIDDESDSTLRLLEAIRPNPAAYFAIEELPSPGQLGPEFVSQLEERVELMRRHRDDPPRSRPPA